MAANSFAISKADTTILGENYAKVTTCKDLDKVRDWTKNKEVVNVFVANDIDCGKKGFDPIGQSESAPYKGIFDGRDHKISGLSINSASEFAGMFGVVGAQAQVKNFTLTNSTLSATSILRVGAVAGLNFGTIDNVTTDTSVTVKGNVLTGGIVGNNGRYGTVSGSTNKAKVSASDFAGGVAGVNTGIVRNSVNEGEVHGKWVAGGIVGWNAYRIQNDTIFVPGRVLTCENNGAVTIDAGIATHQTTMTGFGYNATYAGGIVGFNQDGQLNNCRNNGSVANKKTSSSAYAGGVIGGNDYDGYAKYEGKGYVASVTNAINTSNSVSGSNVGGVAGYNAVTGSGYGATFAVVENCYYDSTILKNVKAIKTTSNATEITVVGMTTDKMKTDSLVEILNTRNHWDSIPSFAWYFESGDYPRLYFGNDNGAYHIVFVVDGKTYFDATTVRGKIVNSDNLNDPNGGAGRKFKGWLDDFHKLYSTNTLKTKIFFRDQVFVASFDDLYEIVFLADYGDTLAVAYFEKGATPFYNETNTPDALETDSVTYVFTGWDKPFAPVTGKETYTAKFDKVYKTFTVKFFVQSVLFGEPQTVAYGQDAQDPGVPTVEGFRFDGWSAAFTNVKADLDIDAKLTEMTELCFDDPVKGTECNSVPVDTTVIVNEPTSNDSITCDAWLNGEIVLNAGDSLTVSQKTELEARCKVNEFDVKFYVFQDLHDSQKVAYGAAAETPADPVVEGFRFDSWDKDFSRIIAALDVNAKMTKMATYCISALGETKCETVPADSTMPTPTVPSDDDSTCTDWLVDGKVFAADSFVAAEVPEFVANCHANELVVAFYVYEGKDPSTATLFETQPVAYGTDANDPQARVENSYGASYRFDGWDKDFSKVVENLDVTGKVTKMTTVCIVALGETKCETVPADTTYTTPEKPSNNDSTCTDWTVNGEVFTAESFLASEVPELVANCHANAFDVKFVAFDSVLVDSQRVAFGDDATAPEAPVFEGFRFDGWDKEFTNVQSDLVVNAKLTAVVEYCVVALGETKCDTVPADTTITTPETPVSDDSTCTEWTAGGEVFTAESFLASEVPELVAVCHANAFDVKFVAFDTVLVDSQRVAYGADATAPEAPVFEGYRFDGWDKEFTNVVADLNVNAQMTAVVEYCVVALGETKCDTVPADTVITTPETPSSDDSTCTDWTVNGEVFTAESFLASEVPELVAVCLAKEFDVKFVAFDTVLVDSQRVAFGTAAVAPDSLVPVFEGYRFNDWDADFTAVESNMVVNAVFDTLVKVTITADVGISTLDTSFYVLKDTTFTGLKSMIDSLSGEYFVCEDITVNGEALADTIVATEDLAVAAKCALVTHTVTYYVDEKVVGTEIVAHGFAAKGAKGPEVAGKFFVKWDKDLHNVVEDIKTNGIYSDVELDTIKVIANGKAIDSIVVAKGDSAEYVLPKIKDTKDSTFLGWKVGDKLLNAGDTIIVKFNDKNIVASFEASTALRNVRALAGFSVHSANGQVQVIGARIGDELSVLDLQGRVIVKKPVMNSVELVNVTTRGSYLVRVGAQTKRVTVR